jgi:hypothetical protein
LRDGSFYACTAFLLPATHGPVALSRGRLPPVPLDRKRTTSEPLSPTVRGTRPNRHSPPTTTLERPSPRSFSASPSLRALRRRPSRLRDPRGDAHHRADTLP